MGDTIVLTEKKADSEVVYFKYLRILASLMVVVIHVCMAFTKTDLFSETWAYATFFNCLSRTAVPIFFCISGALLCNENKKVTAEKTFKKFVRFFVVASVWMLIYYLFDMIVLKPDFLDFKEHLWFICTYVGMILLVPILNLLCKKENKNTIKYLIIVYTFAHVLINFLGLFRWARFIIEFDFYFISSPIIFFITGWYLHNFDVSKYKKSSYVVLVFNFISCIFVALFCYFTKTDELFEYFIKFDHVFVYTTTISIFIIFKYSRFANKEKRVVDSVSKRTFTIYLLHVLIQDLLFLFAKDWIFKVSASWWALAVIPGISLLVYLITLSFAYLLFLIPKKVRKYIC